MKYHGSVLIYFGTNPGVKELCFFPNLKYQAESSSNEIHTIAHCFYGAQNYMHWTTSKTEDIGDE